MSWNRVIQDSDEDEPLEGDGLPPPVEPLQHLESAKQHDHVPANHTNHNTNQHDSAPDESMFPQPNVNLDEFLQSQEGNHATPSSSQVRREKKWIPSTSEGGNGSGGGMMNEIGLAQRRLLDEDPSSAGQQLPSTETRYSTDSVQSAPFPTIPSSYPYPAGPFPGENALYHPAPNGAHTNRNQVLLPNRRDIYNLNGQAPIGQCAVNTPQEAQTQQTIPYSPHDTEPISSVASTRLSGSKSSITGTGMDSPQQSQTSTFDELALPAAPPITQLPTVVETTVAKKKRGRPKKQTLLENDEDDELANSRDHEFKTPGPNGAIYPSDSEQTTENDTPASSGVSDETDEQHLGTAKVDKSAAKAKESKKKQPKKTRSSPVAVPDSDSDDIIWIDTKPIDAIDAIDAEPIQETTNSHTERDIPTQEVLVLKLPKSHEPSTTSTQTHGAEQKTQPTNNKPAPKQRGRKRKQPVEHEEAPTSADTPEPTNPEAQGPGSKLAVLVHNGPEFTPEPQVQTDTSAQEMSHDTNPSPASAPAPTAATTSTSELPQTPSKPDTASFNTPKNAGKGPDKHSPISARSGVPYRVGLSKRARIAPLLKMVRK